MSTEKFPDHYDPEQYIRALKILSETKKRGYENFFYFAFGFATCALMSTVAVPILSYFGVL